MAALSESEARAALGLASVGGVGCLRFAWLVDEYGSADAALEAVRNGAPLPPRTPEKTKKALREARPAPARQLDRFRERGIRVVTYGTDAYPPRLEALRRSPAILYLRGPAALPRERTITVVGTRTATAYGRRMAGDLARGFAEAGWTVVSGLARGIDGAAHRGALEAGGVTAGVVGHGLDHVFPQSHRSLFGRMEREGLLVSEFEPTEPPHKLHFPRRNRILAALSDAVVVVQAGERSGALITAEMASDLGKTVFAVPGPVGPEASVGVHALLRDGSSPATCAHDVLEVLGFGTATARREAGGVSRDRLARLLGSRAGTAAALCRALSDGPLPADALVGSGVGGAAEVRGLLARLEIEGVVRRMPGDRWALRRRGTRPRAEA